MRHNQSLERTAIAAVRTTSFPNIPSILRSTRLHAMAVVQLLRSAIPPPMPFPFSAQRTIAINTQGASDFERVTSTIETEIRNAKPTSITRSGNTITFRAGIFRSVDNWNQLISITSGELQITEQHNQIEIKYKISFTQMLAIVSFMVIFIFGIIPVFLGTESPPIGFLMLAWCWLFGGNYFITLHRFPKFLKSAVARAQSTSIAQPVA